MSKFINNYSNVCLTKNIDNSHRLALNGMRFQPDSEDHTGKFLYISDSLGEVIPLQIASTSVIQVCSEFSNEGNFRKTVQEAITWIQGLAIPASQADKYLISVCSPGTNETTQIVLPDWVYLRGAEVNTSTITLQTALGAGEPFIKMTNSNTGIYSLNMTAGGNADYCLATDPGQTGLAATLERCGYSGGNIATVWIQNSNSLFFPRANIFRTQTSAGSAMLLSGGGGFACSNVLLINSASDFLAGGIAIQMEDSVGTQLANVFESGSSIGFLTAFELVRSFCSIGNTSFAVNINFADVQDASTLSLYSITLSVIGGNIISTDSTSIVNSTGLIFDIDSNSFDPGSVLSLQYLEESQDNLRGSHTIGNLTSGDKNFPSSNFLGSGAYNWVGIKFFKFSALGTTFTDITDALRPSQATTTTMFDAVNDIFYLGDDLQFFTLEADISQVQNAVLNFQYWNGAGWADVDFMATQKNIPYGSYANELFSVVEEQEIRLDVRLSSASRGWSKASINGESKYWIRIQATTLTQSAILNSLRILYNSTKIDQTGANLFYGKARKYQSFNYDLNLNLPANSGPASSDIWFGENNSQGRQNNRLNPSDKFGFTFLPSPSMDTSSPIRLIIFFASQSSAAAITDFTVDITYGTARVGDIIYLTQTTANGNNINNLITQSESFTPNQTNGNILAKKEIEIPIPFIKSRDTTGSISQIFSVQIERTDSKNADLVLISMSVLYLSFTQGISYI